MKMWESILFVAMISVLMMSLGFMTTCGCGDDDDDRGGGSVQTDDDDPVYSGDDDDDDNSDDDLNDDNDADDDDDTDDTDDDTDDDDDTSDFTCNSDFCMDLLTGLNWQNDSTCCYQWTEANNYCETLHLGESSDWRLPTVSELRSLIRGCEDTQTDGACGVSDACLDAGCTNEACFGCPWGEGPTNGCYWPSPLKGGCQMYWSSSAYVDGERDFWEVYFEYAKIDNAHDDKYNNVRCVRDPWSPSR